MSLSFHVPRSAPPARTPVRRLRTALAAGLLAASTTLTLLPQTAAAQAPGCSSTYVVQPGDTVADIARRSNTTNSRIRDCNDLSNDAVRSGETIRVPSGAPTPTPSNGARYRRVEPSRSYRQQPSNRPSTPVNPYTPSTGRRIRP